MSEMTRAKDRKNANVAVQRYTKTAAQLDQLGEQARKLRQEMADATDAVADIREELKGYNERRREQTAKLKEILTPIVRHLQAGGTANGVTGLHNWAAWYNPTAKNGKNAARQIMRIVRHKGDMKSPKDALKGIGVVVGDDLGFSGVEIGANGGTVIIGMNRERNENYKGDSIRDKRDQGDYIPHAPMREDGEIDFEFVGKDAWEFQHNVREVYGDLTFTVYLPGADAKTILNALIEQATAVLKAMRMPTKGLAKEMRDWVKEAAQNEADAKEHRSKAAQKGAATRKRRAAAEKKVKAIADASNAEDPNPDVEEMHLAAQATEKTQEATAGDRVTKVTFTLKPRATKPDEPIVITMSKQSEESL